MENEINLKKIVGENLLIKIQESYLNYLQSSAAIFEVNGDYATALFTSSWCDFLNQASRKLAGDVSEEEALKSGKWICHEDCWATSLNAIKNEKACARECSGGIVIYAVPIIAENMVIGSNNAGVSNPPTDKKKIKEIADRYKVDSEKLLKIAKEYTPRPDYVFNAAKNQILMESEMISNIFMRKQAETEIKKLAEELECRVAAQSLSLMELSTPVIQVWQEIVMLPIVGVIDTPRAAQLMENLLEAIVDTESRVAILDVTGVPVIDTKVAQHLVKTSVAAKMLGAEVIITGISANTAQTLTKLDIDLTAMRTRGNLRAGLNEAFSMIGLSVSEKN